MKDSLDLTLKCSSLTFVAVKTGSKKVTLLTLMAYVRNLNATNLKPGLGQPTNVKLCHNALMMNHSRIRGHSSTAGNTRNVMSENPGSLTTSAELLVKPDLLKIL